MVVLATRRLPGIEVNVAAPPPTEALPRMDVAVFVGFAATGPLYLPVVLESVTQFGAIFGPDAPLAWDELLGQRVYAHLGPAVRAFFSNGGRRCWVIRVARSAASDTVVEEMHRRRREPAALDSVAGVATANTFVIPGVLSVTDDGTIEPAVAQARCEGSWSDSLRVRSALSRQSFALEMGDASAHASPASSTFEFSSRFGLRAGDLVELNMDGVSAYAVIDLVRAAPDPGAPYTVQATVCAAFEELTHAGSPSSPVPETSGKARIRGFGGSVDATLSPALTLSPPVIGDEGSGARLRFDAPMPASLERGHWAYWSSGGTKVWLRMDEIDRALASPGSPAATHESLIDAVATGPAWRELDPVLPPDAGALRRAHLVTVDLRVDGDARTSSLSTVGLTPRHVAAWWDHQTDTDFFQPRERAGVIIVEPFTESEVDRFPLARAEGAIPVAWIPLGATPLFSPALSPLPQEASALERDGLSTFDADLFLDPELASASMHAIPELADSIRFLRENTRALLGMHAALSVGRGGLFNEASLLAIPDAVHVGWERRPEASIPKAEPKNADQPAHWSTHRGECAVVDAPSQDAPDFGVFLDCDTRKLDAPVLYGPDAPVPPGAYRLTWTGAAPPGEYVLIEATQSDFSDAREIVRGVETEYVALAQREGIYYYQVSVHAADEISGGSNVIAVRVRRDEWIQNHPEDVSEALEPEWLAVHRAALRLAAATGELFVVLGMPRHFRTQDALRYAQRLRAVNAPPAGSDPNAFGFTESRATSYGALYFPWLQADVALPPDGAALGVLAARATLRGAWIGAANQPLKDVVALTPIVPALDWQRIQDAQINLVRADPRGFLTLSADTLAVDAELRPINVRRLLILLRRVALRRGHNYVFEPNGPVLRRAVQRGFDILLTDMFRRGAFAGATADQSFRVVTDDTVNTPRDTDAGRLVVELRVAPSVPLSFIAVRLAQSGARLTVTEEL
jgi:hypothetical protein